MKNYKVEICSYNELPSEVDKEELSDNGQGAEYCCYLLIYIGGELKAVYSDAIEPEDARLYRDLRWIEHELERAFKVGRGDSDCDEVFKEAIRDKSFDKEGNLL